MRNNNGILWDDEQGGWVMLCGSQRIPIQLTDKNGKHIVFARKQSAGEKNHDDLRQPETN